MRSPGDSASRGAGSSTSREARREDATHPGTRQRSRFTCCQKSTTPTRAKSEPPRVEFLTSPNRTGHNDDERGRLNLARKKDRSSGMELTAESLKLRGQGKDDARLT